MLSPEDYEDFFIPDPLRNFLLFILLRKVERMSAELEALQQAVSTLESDDEALKLQAAATVVELKGLEDKVKELVNNGVITPEQAKELTDKINAAGTAVTQTTEALKNA